MNGQYFLGDLYPNYFPATTRKQTIPEPEEQKHYEGATKQAPEVIQGSGNIWISILIVLGVLFFLNL